MFTYLKTHKLVVSLILIAVVAGLYLYFRPSKVAYQEYSVTKGSIADTLELSGKVVAETQASLRFPAGGLVTYLGAKEGDVVRKWQTLATIDSRQLQKTLEQKLNLYAIQRGTFEQTIDDNNNSIPAGDLGSTLQRLLEKNQYQLDNVVKDVEYTNLALSLSRLTSPISGILVHAPLDASNIQVLATDTWNVVDPASLYFSADLDETDLKRVHVGQKAKIALDAYPDNTLETTISSISFSPKETTSGTTYEVKLAIPSSSLSELRLGLNGTATIILQEKADVLLLPSSALTVTSGKNSVFIKQGNKYLERDLTTGLENDGQVEVSSGVAEGDRVYIKK